MMDDVTRDYWKKAKQISLSINLSASYLLGDNAKDVQLSHYLDIVDKAAQLLVTVDKCTKDLNHGQSLLVQSRDFTALIYSVFPQLIYSFPSSQAPFAITVPTHSSQAPVPISPTASSPSSNHPQFTPGVFPSSSLSSSSSSSNPSPSTMITSLSSEMAKRNVIVQSSSSPMASPVSPRAKPPFLVPPTPLQTPKIEKIENEDKLSSPESVFTLVGADEEPPKKKRRPRAPAPFIDGMFCHSCGETSTSQWRRGPDGCKSLCNACGIRFANIVNKEKGIPVTNQSIPINMLLNGKQPLPSSPPPSSSSSSSSSYYPPDTSVWNEAMEYVDTPNPKSLPPGWTPSPSFTSSLSSSFSSSGKEVKSKERKTPSP